MIETDVALKFDDLKRAFDLTFQQPLVERGQELMHLLIVRIGGARFALKVAGLAGLARAQTIVPIPGADAGLLGLAGLKGRKVAVYSLAAMIGCPQLSTEQNRWMVLCRCEKEIALAFTAVTGTMMVPRAELSAASPGAPPHAIRLADTMRRALQNGADSRPRLAAIVQADAELLAVGVDRVIHASEVIVHPLPAAASRVSMLAGAVFDAQGNPQLVLNPEALLEAANAAPSQPMPDPSPTPHVLVIDDSLTSRVLLQSILEAGGYKVDLAASGEDAMAKARERHYSLFVCDVEMPGMNGFEFVARTREYDYLLGIPSILVTTRGSADDRRRGAEAGARAYIVKGEFSKDSMLETVRSLVG